MKMQFTRLLLFLAIFLTPVIIPSGDFSALTQAAGGGGSSMAESSSSGKRGRDAGAGPGELCLQKAQALVKEGRMGEAIDSVEEILSQHPGNTDCLLHLGFLYLGQSLPDKAKAAFEAVIEARPRAHEARLGLGLAYTEKGELQLAVKTLKKALALNPNPVRVHYHLGKIYEMMGDPDEAIRHYKAGIDKYLKGRR